MTAQGSGFLANPRTRQHAIVALLGCLLLLNAMTSVNERALFLPSGLNPAAFAAIPEPIVPTSPIGGTGFVPLPLRSFLSAPLLANLANPPTTLLPPAGSPGDIGAPAAPAGGAPVQAPAQSSAFTPDAVNAPGSVGPGSAFNPASPGSFFPGGGTPSDGGIPGGETTPGGGTPGGGTTPGGGSNTPTPVTALPEPTSWLLMIGGLFLIGSALRHRRSDLPAHG